MNSLLVLFLCLGAALAAPKPQPKEAKPETLLEVVLDIVTLLDFHDLHKILDDHLANDGALSAVVDFLQGDDAKQYVADIVALPTTTEYIGWLSDHGIPILSLGTLLEKIVAGVEPGVEPDMAGTLKPFIDQLLEVTPIVDIAALVADKLLTTASFQDWYVYASSEKGHDLMNTIYGMEETKYINGVLEDFEVDIHGFWVGMYAFFVWGDLPDDSK